MGTEGWAQRRATTSKKPTYLKLTDLATQIRPAAPITEKPGENGSPADQIRYRSSSLTTTAKEEKTSAGRRSSIQELPDAAGVVMPQDTGVTSATHSSSRELALSREGAGKESVSEQSATPESLNKTESTGSQMLEFSQKPEQKHWSMLDIDGTVELDHTMPTGV